MEVCMGQGENGQIDMDSELLKEAVGVSKTIRKVFRDDSLQTSIFDLCEYAPYRGFSIRFVAFQYFVVVFHRELGQMGCAIEQGNSQIPLSLGNFSYPQDLEKYLNLVVKDLKLRIPDKFLKEHGWE